WWWASAWAGGGSLLSRASAPSSACPSRACDRGGWRRGRGALRRSGTPSSWAPPAGRRFRRVGDAAGALPSPDDRPCPVSRSVVPEGPGERRRLVARAVVGGGHVGDAGGGALRVPGAH